ncbi:MAG: hypothetical protein EPO22_14040 [Dehalococcoidia bacterium]|nr:MAG: hypothetical protein EPO22_14040 [Dehalococcoidia bacterium]
MKRLSTGALVLTAVLVLAVAAAACGGNDAKSESSASQASIDQLATRVQQNEVLNAVIVITGLPEHEMDSAAQGGKIDNKYVPTARMLARMTALTDWTPDLAPGAKKLHDSSLALLAALDEGKDVAAIKPLSQKAHEDWHMFTDEAWDAVTKSLPADAGGPRPTATPGGAATPASHDMTTPAAGHDTTMTPSGSEMQ